MNICSKIRVLFHTALFACVGLTLPAWAAIAVGGSTTVTLDASGYAKVGISGMSQGGAYTFWTTGAADGVTMDVGCSYAEKYTGETATLETGWLATGEQDFYSSTCRAIVTADAWDMLTSDEFVTYAFKSAYLEVSGDAGASVSISSSKGVVSEILPTGVSEKPDTTVKSVTTNALTKSAAVTVEGRYYYAVPLTAGERYRFTVTKGTDANGGFGLTVEGAEGVEDPIRMANVSTNTLNPILYVVPAETGTHYVIVSGEYGKAFGLTFEKTGMRLPANHPVFAEVDAAAEYPVVVAGVPVGARNDSGDLFYDPVIDASLIKMASLTAGRTYLFETFFDAAVPTQSVMEIYDAKGSVLFRNSLKDVDVIGSRIAFTPSATAAYWVGIAQRDAADTNGVVAGIVCDLQIDDLGVLAAEANDTADGASALGFVLGTAETEGALQGAFRFDATNRVDWYRLDTRRGIAYNLKAVSERYSALRPMNISLYKKNAQNVLVLATDLGDPQTDRLYTATDSATYYVKVSLPDGAGCDYPYALYAWINGSNYGFLHVDLKGPALGAATWNVSGESTVKYVSGGEIVYAAGQVTVQFSALTGWKKPADQTVTVAAGNTRTAVVGKYSDQKDPADDLFAGAVAISPTMAVPVSQSRSLWDTDARDLFKLTVVYGNIYDLSLTDIAGAPYIRVYRKAVQDAATKVVSGEVIAAGRDIRFTGQEAGTYYVEVAHENPSSPVDSSYTLKATAYTVGSVKLDKTAYTVKKGTPSVVLTLSRSGKDGKVRIRYTTVEDTAKANVNYVPQTGVITWGNGTNTPQKVTVTLIPDLYTTYTGDKTFLFKLDVLDPTDFEDGELIPVLAQTEAAVTITETVKASTGTVAFSGYGDALPEAFANPSKAAVIVPAGDALTLWVERAQGSDGDVEVEVATTGTQTAGNEFYVGVTQALHWVSGELSAQPVKIDTLVTGTNQMADGAFTVKLTALKTTGNTVKLGKVSSVAVTVRDPKVALTSSELFATTGFKAQGVTAVDTTKNWFFDREGALRSYPLAVGKSATLTLTLTGPGVLKMNPVLIGAAEGIDTLGAKLGTKVLTELGTVYVPAGKQTLTLTAAAGAGSSGEAYAALLPLDGENVFDWQALTAPTPVFPLNKSVVDMSSLDFVWTASPAATLYRFVLGTNASTPENAPIVNEYGVDPDYCGGCFSLGLVAGKTYYWRAYALVVTEAVTNLTVAGTVNSFVMPAVVSKTTVTTADGTLIEGGGSLASFELIQGLSATLQLGVTTNGIVTYSVLTGKLPDGLAIKGNQITGVPSKAGTYAAVVVGKAGTVSLEAVQMSFTVTPMNLAAGSFSGVLNGFPSYVTSPDVEEEIQQLKLASVSLTAPTTGKLTAKVLCGGKTLSLTATGYSEDVPDMGNGLPGLRAKLTSVSAIGLAKYTNELTLVVCRGEETDPEAIRQVARVEAMRVYLQSRTSTTNALMAEFAEDEENVLYRDNRSVAKSASASSSWAGYYTVALPCDMAQEGYPGGAGYLTLTLDAKGAVKYVGKLPDGTTLTSAFNPFYVLDPDRGVATEVRIPFYAGSALYSVGGLVTLAFDENVGAVVATGELQWNNVNAKATSAGVGFESNLEVVGGYYDKVLNLQAYYLGYTLTAGVDEALLPEALDATYTSLIYYPSDSASYMPVTVAMNTMLTDKRVLVKNPTATTLNDFTRSVNPSNLSIKFTQATGLFTGTFGLWYEGVNATTGGAVQKELPVSFAGVLTHYQSFGSSIYADTPGMGYASVKASSIWTQPLLFTLKKNAILEEPSEGLPLNLDN